MVLLKSEDAKLKAGDYAPDFSLRGASGKIHSLSDYKGAKAFLVVFMCNHCPYVKAKFGRLNDIFVKYSPMGLAMAGINSNDAALYPEDSFDAMKQVASEEGFRFDYLFDESQVIARKYGAACTPDPFLFDSQLKLAYHGRLDNALSPGVEPTQFDMENAVEAVLAGKKPEQGFKPSQGCSIKWKI